MWERRTTDSLDMEISAGSSVSPCPPTAVAIFISEEDGDCESRIPDVLQDAEDEEMRASCVAGPSVTS